MSYPFTTSLSLKSDELIFPVFMPDATFGLVRSVDSIDLVNAGIQAVVMNAFHLMQKPGTSTIQALGGLHTMSGWHRPIITDSGGFQAYSLIRQNSKFGTITAKGINFQPEGSSRKFQLTPEKSIQLQLAYGADVVICLDDCTHVDASDDQQELSVKRTIDWAKRCRRTFDNLLKEKKINDNDRPLIFGVIQGGGIFDLRKNCADELLKIGFDGYGYGGWPLDGEGNLLTDILSFTRNLIPDQYSMHALGIGHPKNVLACFELGYGIFDCAMPTRDARHGRLYQFVYPEDTEQAGLRGDWLKYIYINDQEHIKHPGPLSEGCDCLTCQHFSRGYLHHLFKMNDSLYFRLATIHNLRFMTQLTDRIRTLPHE
jgi:queuine tRNA-ribosyltransferase